MTIAMAWTRKVQDYEQLIFVSDSRISGGETFDSCPKILTLPRTDCAIAFAKAAAHAFPLMVQLSYAIESFPKAKRGAHEIKRVCTHALKVFDEMAKTLRTEISDPRAGMGVPSAEFLFGGYCWRKKCFEIWSIKYDVKSKSFAAHPAPSICYFPDGQRIGRVSYKHKRESYGILAIAGDQGEVAYRRLQELLKQKRINGTRPFHLDMEPFEVVRDMLRDPSRSHSIGGAPQVVKVFQYLRSAPFAVYWPDRKSGRPHLHGRPVLGYEALDKQVIDPDTLEEYEIRALEKSPLFQESHDNSTNADLAT